VSAYSPTTAIPSSLGKTKNEMEKTRTTRSSVQNVHLSQSPKLELQLGRRKKDAPVENDLTLARPRDPSLSLAGQVRSAKHKPTMEHKHMRGTQR
jgi:hypothetical protein